MVFFLGEIHGAFHLPSTGGTHVPDTGKYSVFITGFFAEEFPLRVQCG